MGDSPEEILQSCQKYIPKLITAASKIATEIQSGNEGEALLLLPQVFDGMQWVIDAVQGVQQAGINLKIDLQSIEGHFKELEGALQVRDYVLVADLFDYELEPILREWLQKIEQYLLQGSCRC